MSVRLNITMDEALYKRLKKELPRRKISSFIEAAVRARIHPDRATLDAAFAGPTPGNAGLADRIDRSLGADHHHLRNANDVVTHAWQADELEAIPSLYAPRGAQLERLIRLIVEKTRALDYRQARAGVTTFEGGRSTTPARSRRSSSTSTWRRTWPSCTCSRRGCARSRSSSSASRAYR